MFQPGNKAGKGRPKGSKDKSFTTLKFWFDRLESDWAKLKPTVRAKLCVQLMQMLTNKMKSLPSDPQDSVFNANEALSRLKALEQPSVKSQPANDQDQVTQPINTNPPIIDHPTGQDIGH
jgi:hypothetical protein